VIERHVQALKSSNHHGLGGRAVSALMVRLLSLLLLLVVVMVILPLGVMMLRRWVMTMSLSLRSFHLR
jgi:hypothetical protein